MIRYALPFVFVAGTAFAQQMPGAHFIENWDLNEDGQVTVSEATERRADVFVTFDANDDGFLDAEEYLAFDEARESDMKEHAQPGKGQGLGHRAADGLKLEANDLDNDGKVSTAEFVSGAEGWIATMDKNADGVVSSDDFGQGRGMGKGNGQGNGKG